MSVNQMDLITRPDEFDLGLKWNAKTQVEIDLIYFLLQRKVLAKITNEGTIFGEYVARHENFAQTIKGLLAATLWWSLSLVIFDARRTVDASIALNNQISLNYRMGSFMNGQLTLDLRRRHVAHEPAFRILAACSLCSLLRGP